MLSNDDIADSPDIAIIGLACRFPGAASLDDFWRNLCLGKESVSFFSDEELLAAGVDSDLLTDPNFVKAGTLLPDYDRFDAGFFGLSPQAASILDPQHRVLLECAWEAIEHAGYDPKTYPGAIGVFAGSGLSHYLLRNLLPRPELLESGGGYQVMMDNNRDSLPTRISYKLNLKGPSVNVQTACSTSLSATHLACQSLLSGECDMALAGGVSILIPQKQGHLYQPGMIYSPDGHCRAFAADAKGTIGGNGAGLVLLKRMSEALASGDTIHAVIKGSAVNNDGGLKVSYTAPSVDGQAQVIREALAVARAESETIRYVETHGTGTALGDPVEIAALTQAFATDRRGFCAIGSVKTNIGHADAAAGIAGLIKTVLALKHRVIPPSLHFDKPNPAIDFENGPFYVNTQLTSWEPDEQGTPRRAGVSAFGVGGTNAHIILEEAPAGEASGDYSSWQLLLLSAKSEQALDKAGVNLADYLDQQPAVPLHDVAYTLAAGRHRHSCRQMMVCQTKEEAIQVIRRASADRVTSDAVSRPVAFLFPGQGAQYVNMGRGLYDLEPVFRDEVDRCVRLLQAPLGLNLRKLLYPEAAELETAALRLNETALTQPAIFTISYALAKLWQSWDVMPRAMLGHSVGEYVAATLAGVFDLEDALRLVAVRGRLMQSLPRGAMLAVSLPEMELRERLRGGNARRDGVTLAAVNGPKQCVISGPLEAVEAWRQQLTEQGTTCRVLNTSHAFHSPMMEPILEAFTAQVRTVHLQSPRIPFLSNLTGDWITDSMVIDPTYWSCHLRETVRFSDGLQELLKEPELILLEIGPGRSLAMLTKNHPGAVDRVVLNSLRHPTEEQSDDRYMLASVGRFWQAGGDIDWNRFYAGQRRHRLALPTYPFERQRYWIEPPKTNHAPPQTKADGALKRQPLKDWFYSPAWQRSMTPHGVDPSSWAAHRWLLFVDDLGLGHSLAQRLRTAGQDVITVRRGAVFAKLDNRNFVIDPADRAGYAALFNEVAKDGKLPARVVHLWSVSGSAADLGLQAERLGFASGFESLLCLVQAIDSAAIEVPLEPTRITVITDGLQDVTGEERLHPAQAAVLGLIRVIPQEHLHLVCRSVDIRLNDANEVPGVLVDQLIAELAPRDGECEQVIAYRGRYRWEQTFNAVPLPETAADLLPPAAKFRKGGVYLITGGLGRISLALAEAMADLPARWILIGHSPFPERASWDSWLTTHGETDPVSAKIRKLKAIERAGSEVLVIQADVSSRERMKAAVEQATRAFGHINGVIHGAAVTKGLFQLSRTLDPEECVRQFRPKIGGLLVLHELMNNKDLDFCILLSSLSTVLGGLGMAAYSAANAVMESFVHWRNRRYGSRWLSVSLDAWQTAAERPADQPADLPHGMGSGLQRLAMTNAEGVEALRRAASHDGQFIVSTANLAVRRAAWNTDATHAALSREQRTGLANDRPRLRNGYIEPRSSVEKEVAGIWRDLLGVEQIGATDNFWELGGDSLLGTQLIARISRTLQVSLSLDCLFDEPTVSGLAIQVEARQLVTLRPPSPEYSGGHAGDEVEVEEGAF